MPTETRSAWRVWRLTPTNQTRSMKSWLTYRRYLRTSLLPQSLLPVEFSENLRRWLSSLVTCRVWTWQVAEREQDRHTLWKQPNRITPVHTSYLLRHKHGTPRALTCTYIQHLRPHIPPYLNQPHCAFSPGLHHTTTDIRIRCHPFCYFTSGVLLLDIRYFGSVPNYGQLDTVASLNFGHLDFQ